MQNKLTAENLNLKVYEKRKRYGFTLSEVLIALVVLGIVSALTIPGLVHSAHKHEYVSGLKKVYSTLSAAAHEIIMEEGAPGCDEGGWACSNIDVYNTYRQYLILQRTAELLQAV